MLGRVSQFLAIVVLLTGCSIKQSADDMKKGTDEIKEQSKHLGKRTNDLEQELTFKESYDMLVFKGFNALFGETETRQRNREAGLNIEPDLLLYAGGAIESMWFQFWKGDYGDDQLSLDRRFKLGLEILFVRATKHIPRDFPVDVLKPTRSYLALASLAAKLERVRPEYAAALKLQNYPELNLYEVIISSLKNRGTFERKEFLPEAAKMTLQWKQDAIYLLQLRHNYLPMMVLGRLTDLQDRGDLSRAAMWLRGQKVDIGRFDPEQLIEWTQWLRLALKTRQDLIALGLPVERNQVFRELAAGVDFGQANLVNVTDAAIGSNALLKVQREFARAYSEVTKP